MDLRSTENLYRDQLNSNDTDNIMKLSFGTYFKESIKELQSLERLDDKIYDIDLNYSNTLRLLKSKYAQSREDNGDNAEETKEIKSRFGANVKNWFIRVWAVIVSFFTRLFSMIVNLIKSLILFIQKKRVMKNVYVKQINEVLGKNLDSELAEKIVEGLVKGKKKVYTISKLNNNINAHDGATFREIHDRIADKHLASFIRDNAIVLKNKKSAFDLETLEALLNRTIQKQEGINENDEFRALQEDVMTLKGAAILNGAITKDSKPNKSPINFVTYGAYASEGKVKELANMLVYGTDVNHKVVMSTVEFLGIEQPGTTAITELSSIMHVFNIDTETVVGKGGLVDILCEILKQYKSVAAEDAKRVKSIEKVITTHMQALTGATEKELKLQKSFKKFTNLIVSVKQIKADFIALRQYMLGNIMSLLEIENTAIRQILNVLKADKPIKDDKDSIVNVEPIAKDDDKIFKESGENYKSHITYE